MVRPSCVDKDGLRKGAWTQEEDNKLRAYILRYGHWNWRLLPKYAGLARCGKSCRLRWINYLKPGIKRGDYSKEEEDLIAKLHHQLGNKWSVIAAKLPGRTDNEIKNYYHTHLKKRQSDEQKIFSSDENMMSHNSRHCKNIYISDQELELELELEEEEEEASSLAFNNINNHVDKFSGNLQKLEASDSDHHIHILESSGSKCPILDSEQDSNSSTAPSSAYNYNQQLQKSFLWSYDDDDAVLSETSTQFQNFQDVDNIYSGLMFNSGGGCMNSRAISSSDTSLIGGFEESFWTQPFLVDTQIDYNYYNLLPF